MDCQNNFFEFETKTGIDRTELVLGDNMKVVDVWI